MIINTSEIVTRQLVFYLFDKDTSHSTYGLDPNSTLQQLHQAHVVGRGVELGKYMPNNSTMLSTCKLLSSQAVMQGQLDSQCVRTYVALYVEFYVLPQLRKNSLLDKLNEAQLLHRTGVNDHLSRANSIRPYDGSKLLSR